MKKLRPKQFRKTLPLCRKQTENTWNDEGEDIDEDESVLYLSQRLSHSALVKGSNEDWVSV